MEQRALAGAARRPYCPPLQQHPTQKNINAGLPLWDPGAAPLRRAAAQPAVGFSGVRAILQREGKHAFSVVASLRGRNKQPRITWPCSRSDQSLGSL